ncbi:MAG: hypothetical protein ACI9TY_000334 [Alphaproteobacteria bacterium]|jgi:hypothetical protein
MFLKHAIIWTKVIFLGLPIAVGLAQALFLIYTAIPMDFVIYWAPSIIIGIVLGVVIGEVVLFMTKDRSKP